nr:unnamed protein product [Digitaria exilis]
MHVCFTIDSGDEPVHVTGDDVTFGGSKVVVPRGWAGLGTEQTGMGRRRRSFPKPPLSELLRAAAPSAWVLDLHTGLDEVPWTSKPWLRRTASPGSALRRSVQDPSEKESRPPAAPSRAGIRVRRVRGVCEEGEQARRSFPSPLLPEVHWWLCEDEDEEGGEEKFCNEEGLGWQQSVCNWRSERRMWWGPLRLGI